MNAKEMWKFYKENENEDNYEAWSYGVDADLLADLTLKRIKTATASAYTLYLYENEPLPKTGGYNIILDSNDNAVCITQTTKVYVVPFNKVTKRHAFKEGEGNRTLTYWREVHKTFFEKELDKIGEEFNENMNVVCEEFEVVYPK